MIESNDVHTIYYRKKKELKYFSKFEHMPKR